jgi:hypothetical protein
MAEALAMKERLLLANRMGCNSMIAEGDSTETIEACIGAETWWSDPAAIYVDCLDIATFIGEVFLKFCLREANKTAHELARVCFLNKVYCIWDDEPPSFFISNIITTATLLM